VTVALLGLIGVTARLEAAAYYVSPSGSAKWPACANISTPCAPLTAFANAVAGDTVYFRGGQYEVGQSTTWGAWPWVFQWRPANSGTPGSPITFRNYPGETVVINGNVSGAVAGTWDGLNHSTCVMGVVGKSYITIDGFTFQADNGAEMASVLIYGNSTTDRAIGCIVRNCIFNGGTQEVNDGNNWEGLRVEHTSALLVSNCIFFNYRAFANQHNTSGYKGYGNVSGVLENIEAFNCTVALYLKGTHTDFTVRNNFVHDSNTGILITPDTVNMISDRVKVINNVIANIVHSGIEQDVSVHGDDWVIANNTIYNVAGTDGGGGIIKANNQATHGLRCYNNIVTKVGGYGHLVTRANGQLAEADHNEWGPTFTLRMSLDGGQRVYLSLTTWQASTELAAGTHPGIGDLASDPKFVNGSGTLSQLRDFVLQASSPCKGAGRNGMDIGALDIATTVGYGAVARGTVAPPGTVAIRHP
jgi:hypothetical protein